MFKTAGMANKTHKCLPENLKHVCAESLLSNPKLCQWAELSLPWRHVNASCLFIDLSGTSLISPSSTLIFCVYL